MSARILNSLAPDQEGELLGTVEEAEAKLQEMEKALETRGFRTSIITTPEGPELRVSDGQGRPTAVFYISVDE